MLDEYIIQHLREIEIERAELTKKLQVLTDEENKESDRISRLLETEDMGTSLFSPRSCTHETQERVNQIEKHLKDLQYEEMSLRQKIEENQENNDRYQKLLTEARKGSAPAADETTNKQPDIAEDQKKEIETILKKVEVCLDLSHRDTAKCRAELTNLKYYLKALLSNQEL